MRVFLQPLSPANASARAFSHTGDAGTDIKLLEDVDQLHWKGPTDTFDELAARLDAARTEARRSGAQRSRGVVKR